MNIHRFIRVLVFGNFNKTFKVVSCDKMMKKKRRGIKSKQIYPLLILFFFVFVFLGVVLLNLEYMKDKGGNLEGELNTLRWGSDGIEVSLSKDAGGRVVLSLVSNQDWEQAIKSIGPIIESANILIDKMENQGAPVKRDEFSFDVNAGSKTLNLNFEKGIAETILKGVVLFLDHAEDICGTEFVEDVIDKVEDSNVHEVNLTATSCNIFSVPGLLASIDFAELYVVISQTEDFKDLTLYKNKNAIAVLNLENHFEFEEECSFDVSSEKNNLKFHIDSNNLLDIYPNTDWVGKEKVFVKLTCGSEELRDSFYVNVLDSVSSAGGTGNSNGVGGVDDGEADDSVEDGSSEDDSGSDSGLFKILNPIPEDYLIAVSRNEEKIFSIDNNDYETIEWHLDGELMDNDFNSFKFEALEEGKHIIKVVIGKGSLSDSKTWKAVVKDSLENPAPSGSFGKKIIIYLMIFVGLIIVGLVVVVVFKRKRKEG